MESKPNHPSLIFSVNGVLAFIFLPINPHYGLVAADKSKIEILSAKANLNDNANLNALQAERCIDFVYSDHDLSKLIGEGKALTKWFNKVKPKGFAEEDSWQPEFIDYKTRLSNGLSFLRIVE